MTAQERTKRDLVYISILQREGPLSTDRLANFAKQSYVFHKTSLVAVEQDTKRFAKHYEAIGMVQRREGKLHWLASTTVEGTAKEPARNTPILSKEGFLTSRAGVTCEHCGRTIDLSESEPHWRVKNRLLLLALAEHHYFRVTCKKCNWEGKYDANKDVKPILD